VALDVLQAMGGSTLTPAMEGAMLGIDRIMALQSCLWWLLACAAIAFFMPNAYDLLGRGILRRQEEHLSGRNGNIALGALLILCLLLLAISETRGISEFLYFNF
jgi:alginate O-acetyltransferase complex protein AlgI